MKGDDIAERLLDFGARIMNLCENLPKTLSGRHVAKQMLRCGTSAGANFEEARGGESRADFTHKLGVSWKETRETLYWLRLAERAKLTRPNLLQGLIREADALSRILAKSIQTAKRTK